MKSKLSHFYSWNLCPFDYYPNLIREFADNGSNKFVLTHFMTDAIFNNKWYFPRLKRMFRDNHAEFQDVHLPFGQPYDLACADRGRRAGMLDDQKRMMAFAADLGCRTCTIHIGAYESVFFKTPNSEISPVAAENLGVLLKEAENLGVILCVENSYERSNTPDEVLYYINCYDSPNLGVCYDSGHACLMSDFPGKERSKYFTEMDDAWGDTVECYDDAIGKLLPHIVTCHLHDNDGYSDAHRMPGDGRINWQELIAKLKTAPRLLTIQSEVSCGNRYSIKNLVGTFDRILD